jgi:triosephosphate isomerase (TIM)
MRKKIVAGNWKMNKNLEEAIALIEEVITRAGDEEKLIIENKLIILAPPFPFITEAVELTDQVETIKIAAQNCHSEEKGAFTGEVSAPMLRSAGAEYVIIGHSERRNIFKESDDFLAMKVNTALHHGLKPIFCCGELLPEREKNNHFHVVKQQLEKGLFHLSQKEFREIVIAYEPVWAIGTGVNATAGQAQEMHAYIRRLIEEKYNSAVSEDTVILYGGSCNAKNAAELFANPDVDGGLIGGASLIAQDFVTIVNSF